MNPTLPVPEAELRAAANSPEVHAAAMLAAKDLLLNRPDIAAMPSDTAAASIAMHAAVILRTYLDIVAAEGLIPDLGQHVAPPQ